LVAQSNVSELGAMAAAETAVSNSPEGLMMATVITATIPIIIVYPFLQKHFMKGILTGSLKG
jgi:ABC-type glycerol-3-phosphate transport system permease component